MLLEYIILVFLMSVNRGVCFSRIKTCFTVDKEKTCKNFLTNKKLCVKIEHPRGRGIKHTYRKSKDLYIHALYELTGMQTAPLVLLCVDV